MGLPLNTRLHTYTISSELFLCDHANLQPAANCQPEACAPDQWRDGGRNHQRTISSEALFGEDCEASFCMALTLLAVQVSKKNQQMWVFQNMCMYMCLNRTCNALLLLACNDSKWCLPSLVSSSSRKVLPFQCCLLNIRTLWSYFDYVMPTWEKIPGSLSVHMFAFRRSLGTRLPVTILILTKWFSLW